AIEAAKTAQDPAARLVSRAGGENEHPPQIEPPGSIRVLPADPLFASLLPSAHLSSSIPLCQSAVAVSYHPSVDRVAAPILRPSSISRPSSTRPAPPGRRDWRRGWASWASARFYPFTEVQVSGHRFPSVRERSEGCEASPTPRGLFRILRFFRRGSDCN